ncbi:MAG: PAS domain-containing protein, partial [Alphaproteobacteria bacterium]|nr:PAS domain-containing protein [Alphaproteobacteria bacterium]
MDAARRFWARWTGNSAAIGLIAVAGGGLVLAGWPEWGAGLAILAGLWALARARFRPDASVETRLRAALERTDVGVCLYDRDDRVVALTRAFWGPFVRLEDKNFVGRHYDDMMRAVYDAGYFPESLKGKVDFEQRIAELKRARRSGSGVPRLVEIEGRWYQLTDHLTDDGGMMTVRTDITDAKRAEIRLQEAIDAMDGGFALWDAEDRLVLVNRAFERMYGKLSKEESIGRTFSELQVQAYEAGYYPQFPNLAAFDFWLGKVVHQRRSEPGIPRQNRTSAGHWYQTIESRTADGGLATITTDITDTKQAEERLRDAIENIDSGFCLYGPDGKVVLHNAKFLEPYPELAIEGVIGRSMVENVRYLRAFGYYPEYKTEAEFEALLVRVAEFQRNPPSEPQIFEPKPGMWVQNFYHRTANGGMVTIRVDITALKRAEARLRDAIESLDSGFCLFGADGRVVMHNAKYLEPYPELKA